MSYFEQYKLKFPLVKFTATTLPSHLFYHVHPGAQMSTDVDFVIIQKSLFKHFFKDGQLILKELSEEQLIQAIDQFHNEVIPSVEAGYRKSIIYVTKTNPPEDVAPYFRKKYANNPQIEKEIALLNAYKKKGQYLQECILIRMATNEDQALNHMLAETIFGNIKKEKIIEILAKNLKASDLTLGNLAKHLQEDSEAKKKLISELPENKNFQKLFTNCQQLFINRQDLRNSFMEIVESDVMTGLLLSYQAEERKILLKLLREFQFIPVLPDEVPSAIQNFYKELYKKIQEGDPIEAADYACREYTRIHPKKNGNGRISRAIANLILMQAGIVPPIFTSDEEYMQKLQASNEKPVIFIEYLNKLIHEFAHMYHFEKETYAKEYIAFTDEDLLKFNAFAEEREKRSRLGLLNTAGSERRDYNPNIIRAAKDMGALFENSNIDIFSPLNQLKSMATSMENRVDDALTNELKDKIRAIAPETNSSIIVDHKALEARALTQSQSGHYVEAIKYYQQALDLRQKNNPKGVLGIAADYYNIACCYLKLNKQIDALTNSEQALKILPDNAQAQKLKENLNSLIATCRNSALPDKAVRSTFRQ